jgi:hemolysin III
MRQLLKELPKDEAANTVSHGIAVVLSIIGTVLLVQKALEMQHPTLLVSYVVYGIGITFLFAASTLYHYFQSPATKLLLRKFDHIGIYVMIAGTYTPFTLVTMAGTWAENLFFVVWGIAIFGVVFKIFFTGRFEKLSLVIYVVLGWLVIVAAQPMIEKVATGGLWLLVAGGLAFTVGVVFYRWKSLFYHHAIWHVFVMLGGIFHYFSVLFYALPA